MTEAPQDALPSWPIPRGLDVVDIDGYPLAVREAGLGGPVILIHGSLGDYRSWDAQIGALSSAFRAIAPSLRHYYPEPWDGRGGDFSLTRHAEDIAALIARMGLQQAHLVGHSRGGAVALLVAMRYSGRVRSLVLAEPRGLEDLLPDTPESRRLARESDAIFAELHRDLALGDPVAAARNFVEAFAGPGAWERRSEEQRQALLDNIATGIDSGERPGLTAGAVSAFGFPVLPVVGAAGARRYVEGFQAMRAANPAIPEPVAIADAGHAMHRDNPQAFNAAVIGFLRSVETARRAPARPAPGRVR